MVPLALDHFVRYNLLHVILDWQIREKRMLLPLHRFPRVQHELIPSRTTYFLVPTGKNKNRKLLLLVNISSSAPSFRSTKNESKDDEMDPSQLRE